jgi:hypothetical protein
MNQITLILIYSGSSELPQYLRETFEITSRIAKNSRIVFLANQSNYQNFKKLTTNLVDQNAASIEFIAIEDIPQSEQSKSFQNQSTLDKNFREGFWYQASNRFMVLADYMTHAKISNVIHIENDYVLYFDPTDKLEQFREFADFAVPVDRIRAIPGIVWLKTPHTAEKLAQFILSHPDQDDMASVGQFCLSTTEMDSKPLPTIPEEYAKKNSLDQSRYCRGIKLFGGIFDAAAIGQYIGGIHWMNNPADTTFFENESSDFQVKDFSFAWGVCNGARYPSVDKQGERVKVLGVHAHSKNLSGISPFNHGVPIDTTSLVTGERIQECCEITLGTPSITRFHGRQNIKTKDLIEIGEDSNGNLISPSIEMIESLAKAKTIFTYTHLVPYFKYFIGPRINTPFTLVTHNSDHPVTIKDFQLLNHPSLKNWFAQNSEFNHDKLRGLPIGLQNKQWGAEKLEQLIEASRQFIKSELLYVNFSPSTHPSRSEALTIAKELPNTTVEAGVDYKQYLSSLAKHKFCICPRGNGIDTHRFWEAQYFDCIPIILWRDWTASYSGMPVLILDNWAELKSLHLEKAYISISTKTYPRSNLDLRKIKEQILQ